MKKISLENLSAYSGGSNRQCLIDGVLTGFAISLGFAFGGLGGAGAALLGGLYAGNSNGCFS